MCVYGCTDTLRVACPMLLYPTRVCAVSRLARLLPGSLSVISVHRSLIVSYRPAILMEGIWRQVDKAL